VVSGDPEGNGPVDQGRETERPSLRSWKGSISNEVRKGVKEETFARLGGVD
jgi:hypothetical protein